MSHTDSVIKDTIRFKLKLSIGEDAYTSLKISKHLSGISDVVGSAATGASIASSNTVASYFFGGGILNYLGLASATTPIGWVAAAAVISAGSYLAYKNMYSSFRKERVKEIPEFINTPIDELGFHIFNFYAPLSIMVASADGEITKEEKLYIIKYFVSEWGYNENFVKEELSLIEKNINNYSLEEISKKYMDALKRNPDCNSEEIIKETVKILNEISIQDGFIHEKEKEIISEIESILNPRENIKKHIENKIVSLKTNIKKYLPNALKK